MRKKYLACVIIFFLLSACTSQGEQRQTSWETEYKNNQAKWESQHIINYRMSIDGYGYGLSYSVTVEVKGGEILSVVDNRGESISPNDKDILYDYPDKFTITGLFSYVYQTYLENPPELKVSYDSTFGYPEIIYVDPYTEPCCQDFTYRVYNFEVLP